MNDKVVNNLQTNADEIRRVILEMAYKAQSAHTGGSLSCVDLLTVLYFDFMKVDPKNPFWDERDRFVFSKAHDCKAIYATLFKRGYFKKEILDTYETEGGLPGHSTRGTLPGIEVSAGSLGHGLPIACGMALAGKLDKKPYRVVAVLSDGECDEGSTWEAILFAGHQRLDNLIVVVDYNKLQGFGRTEDVLNLEPFRSKFLDFGWGVKEVNGHNVREIKESLSTFPFIKNKPSVIIAHTVKGYNGVLKHINQVSSHYKPPQKEELEEIKIKIT